ncbi:MAG TPA: hypothetical protein PK090_06025 [Smithellaceae bacterium]|nr:hypothetical protein [Smithellaceae bacterium]
MIIIITLAVILLCLFLLYATFPKSRKQFLKNLLSQAKYLIPRYFT